MIVQVSSLPFVIISAFDILEYWLLYNFCFIYWLLLILVVNFLFKNLLINVKITLSTVKMFSRYYYLEPSI